MNELFLKPTDDLVGKAMQWFDFQDADIVTLDEDDVKSIIHGAENVLLIEAKATGENRMKDAIEMLKSEAKRVAPAYDFNSARKYLLQMVGSNDAPLKMEETAELTDMFGEMPDDTDIIWGLSNRDDLGGAVIIRMAAADLS